MTWEMSEISVQMSTPLKYNVISYAGFAMDGEKCHWQNGRMSCAVSFRVEFLCHDINIHIPHHLSARIPFYHLREATASLKENWGQVGNSTCLLGGGRNGWLCTVCSVGHVLGCKVPVVACLHKQLDQSQLMGFTMGAALFISTGKILETDVWTQNGRGFGKFHP